MMKNIVASLVFVCFVAHAFGQNFSLIPEPVSIKQNSGTLTLGPSTSIVINGRNAEAVRTARLLSEKLKSSFDWTIDVKEAGTGTINLSLNQKADAKLGGEGYTLDVTRSSVDIRANSPAGIFYGVQTLIQILPKEVEGKGKPSQGVSIPSVTITDYPRFKWRGIMLDVSRHFFPKEYVKSYIDQIARYKFNRLHWHLTDDNGWRVEIKSLPKLTEVGAWRVPRVGTFGSNDAPKPGEKASYGGFYTQADIKEVVQYAKDRFVEILPEVDVPGHSMAALAAYPELSVTKDTSVRVNPGSSFATWHGNGKFTMHIDNTLNPTDENVYKFLDKVFTEIAAMFPYEFIHIGGDECYKGYWERDPGVQAFMKKNNIKDGIELQSYFSRRVTKIVTDKKKKVIGWDEILEGGLPPGAAVMSWRGTKGGIEAAHQKREVVMSPAPVYYLDMIQGEPSIEPPVYDKSLLRTVYDHEVIPAGVDSTFILGGQGNLWTEQIPTTAQVEYMTYPRAFAMAESFWSPKSKKNWDQFVPKVEQHMARFDEAGINYASSMYDPVIRVKKQKGTDRITIEMTPQVADVTIHYSYDNSIPTRYSTSYKEPVEYPAGADSFKVLTFRNGKPIGRLIHLTTEQLQKRARE